MEGRGLAFILLIFLILVVLVILVLVGLGRFRRAGALLPEHVADKDDRHDRLQDEDDGVEQVLQEFELSAENEVHAEDRGDDGEPDADDGDGDPFKQVFHGRTSFTYRFSQLYHSGAENSLPIRNDSGPGCRAACRIGFFADG